MSRIKTVLGGLGLAGTMMAAIGFWQAHLPAPTGYVRVRGELHHLQVQDLHQVTAPLLDSYWTLDLAAITAAVQALAWVDTVRAERVWPDILILDIREQNPVLRWGPDALLNARGEKFVPADISAYTELPLLTGPTGYEARLFTAYRNMAAALQPLGWRIVHLQVDERRSWRLHLDSGTKIILGRTQPEATFARVVSVLERLGTEQCRLIEYLDARYEHGFAIRWRTDQPTMKTGSHG